MKKYILLLICVCIYNLSTGQGYNHNWLLGYDNAGIPPYTSVGKAFAEIDSLNINIFSQSRKMPFMSSQANISDSAGNLLFYTNGCWIANATGDTMMNGDSLNPGNFSDGYCTLGYPIANMELALPVPGMMNKYILFHQTGDQSVWSRKLYYSLIDMSLDSGRGAVTAKNQIAFSDSLISGISACKHANGRDWWVAVLKDSSDIIYTLLLTPNGITNIQQQHLNVPMHISFSSIQAFSPDGSKYAYTVSSATGNINYPYLRDLRILDFDRCSGQFSNPYVINLNDTNFGVGLSFSSSSQYLYTSKAFQISQFDLLAPNIQASRQFVAWYDFFNNGGYTTFGYMYLAANGKIYISSTGGTIYFSVIDQPDSAGMSCNVLQHAIQTPCYIGASHVNHPNYYLGRLVGSPCDTLTGIHDLAAHDFRFSISPNPNNGNFRIMYLLPQNKSGTLQIFNITGKEIYHQNLPLWSTLQYISLPKIADGVYQCTITSNNQRVNKKLVVVE